MANESTPSDPTSTNKPVKTEKPATETYGVEPELDLSTLKRSADLYPGAESKQRSAKATVNDVELPVSAYVMALLSAAFVAIGSFFAIPFLPLVTNRFGIGMQSTMHSLVAAGPLIALGLGALSGWQTFKQHKKKAIAQLEREAAIVKATCPACGESVAVINQSCPMCGQKMAKPDER